MVSLLRMSGLGSINSPRSTPRTKVHATQPHVRSSRDNTSLDLSLKTVIGTTTDSGNGFDSVPQLNTYAVCAGSAVIVARVDEDLNIIQRFYRAGPSAAAVNPSTSFYSPPTPNILGENSKGTLFRHGNYGNGSPAAIGDASTVSPGRSRASARTRCASCVSVSADGQLLAIGEVIAMVACQISTDHCRQATIQGSLSFLSQRMDQMYR